MNNFNPLAGMANVEVYENGVWFTCGGIYVLEVNRLLFKATRKGPMFIAEFTVMSSTRPEHAQGSAATWMQKMQDPAIGLPAVKGFLLTLIGLFPDDPIAKVASEMDPLSGYAISSANPFAGFMVNLETVNKLTKAKTNFTLHDWSTFDYAAFGFPEKNPQDILRASKAYVQAPVAPQGYAPPPPPPTQPVREYSPDGYYERVNGGPWSLVRR